MHTILVIGGGLILLVLGFAAAYFTGQPFARYLPWFLLVWLLCASINMWIGISRAGYSFMEELPIFVVIFAVPAVIAWLLVKFYG